MWDVDEISGLKKLGWFPAEVLFDPRSGLLMTNDSSPRLQMYPDSANVPLLFTHKGHASWTPHNSTRLWIDTGVDIVLSVLRPSYSGLLSQDRSKYLPRLRVGLYGKNQRRFWNQAFNLLPSYLIIKGFYNISYLSPTKKCSFETKLISLVQKSHSF